MSDDIIMLRPSPDRDPDGSRLRDTLAAHCALELARGRRWTSMYAFMFATVVVAILLQPSAWPPLRIVAVIGWVLSGLAFAAALLSERHWHRRRAELVTSLR